MSNFDFDELDKAVADALGTNETSVSFSDTAADFVNKAEETSAPEKKSEPEPTPEPVQPEEKPAAPVAPLAARRSSGRFMDVVHPSSDMRSASASRAAFTPPKPVQASSDKVEDTSDINDNFENISDLGWSKPVESPFLPDAKVEKRPLGAEVPTGAATNTASDEEELLLEAPDDPRIEATTMPDPIDFAAQSSALATETEDTGTLDTSAFDEPFTLENVAPEMLETLEVSETAEADESPKALDSADVAPETPETPEASTIAAPAPVTPVTEPTGPASITQQYEEKPSSQQESGAIYDTENYHQPVTDVTKKSHGAWTIIWIIALVILGAAAGVAFYLFILPML